MTGLLGGIGRGLEKGSANWLQALIARDEKQARERQLASQDEYRQMQMMEMLSGAAERERVAGMDKSFSEQMKGANRPPMDYEGAFAKAPMPDAGAAMGDPTANAGVPVGYQGMMGAMQGSFDIDKALIATLPYVTKNTEAQHKALMEIKKLPIEEQKRELAALVAASQISRNRAQETKALKGDKASLKNETEEKYDEKTGVTFKRSFNYDPATGEKSGFSDWTPTKKDRPPAQVNVNTSVGTGSMEKLGEEMSKSLVSERKDVEGAANSLRGIAEAEKLLNSGMITGSGAEYLVTFGNFLSSRLGMKFADDPVANTQAFAATMGNQVGQIIKQFGSGTGLSDADREYAEKIVGGKITLNEQAIRKLIAINKKAYTNVVEGFNKRADHAMTRPGAEQLPYDLRVTLPTPTKGGGGTIKYDAQGNRVK